MLWHLEPFVHSPELALFQIANWNVCLILYHKNGSGWYQIEGRKFIMPPLKSDVTFSLFLQTNCSLKSGDKRDITVLIGPEKIQELNYAKTEQAVIIFWSNVEINNIATQRKASRGRF
jgi:hypothetical protein